MKNIYYIIIFVFVVGLLFSCEDYLDKSPEADISEKDVFGNFTSFQGFVEELYACIVDPNKGGAWNPYLFADETLNNYPYRFDNGNYWGSENYFYGSSPPTGNDPRAKRIWEHSWYAIRKANLTIEKLKEKGLFGGTDEERDLLMGQALFFRGWFYFEICRYWGGMPYITRVLDPTESLVSEEFKRLNFQQTAQMMAKDFRAAADLLPNHWDESGPGQITIGHNNQRVNKFFALGYLGKVLLYAGSPMMNEEATGYDQFDGSLCGQAAEAFGELLSLADQTGIYKMQPWETWTDCFWRWNDRRPGGTECIMMPTVYIPGRVRWSTAGATYPSSFGLASGSEADVPTHNFVKNYAMANGLPIDDPDSGYDPKDPWTGREPRFYKDIVVDGDRIHQSKEDDMYAQLYNGGRHRSQINPPSVTGYYSKRFSPMGPDLVNSKVSELQAYVPYLRLADIYLMYAEAVSNSTNGSPQSAASNYDMTAADAVNVVRNRAQIPDLDEKYIQDNSAFFEQIVRERAVELAFEGARFCDLRRWNRNDDPRYLDKTAIDFDRGPDGKPINLHERVVVRRVAEKKHNWLPIQVKFTKLYEGFPQNPGW